MGLELLISVVLTTSNVRSGKLFGIPVSGTHARFKHMVMNIKLLKFMQNAM